MILIYFLLEILKIIKKLFVINFKKVTMRKICKIYTKCKKYKDLKKN